MKKVLLLVVMLFSVLTVSFWYDLSNSKVEQINKVSKILVNKNSENTIKKYITQLDAIHNNYNNERHKAIIKYLWIKFKEHIEKKEYFKVNRIVDWDTIELKRNWKKIKIRLIWVNTPETNEEYWDIATNKLSEKILWKYIYFDYDNTQTQKDIFWRHLWYVYLEKWKMINKWLIENWYWKEYTYKIDYKFKDDFEKAQEKAKNNNLWVWKNIEETNNEENIETDKDNYKYYVSSHHTSKYYYCETDKDWENLSESYLQEFSSESKLLEKYPDHILHKECK